MQQNALAFLVEDLLVELACEGGSELARGLLFAEFDSADMKI